LIAKAPPVAMQEQLIDACVKGATLKELKTMMIVLICENLSGKKKRVGTASHPC